jgi:hypothetical protein
MTDKPSAPRGRPTKNKVEPIAASAKQIAKAIFRAAEKKATAVKPKKRKPN